MELTLRLVQLDDAAGIVTVLNPIIAAGCYTALDTPLTLEYERQYITAFSPRGVWYVALNAAGRIIGLQDIAPFAGDTTAFDHVGVIGTFVDLAQRRAGVGRRLAEASFPAACAQGYEKLFTSVRADNPAALAFYGSLGFERVGLARRQARFGQGAQRRYVDEVMIERWL